MTQQDMPRRPQDLLVLARAIQAVSDFGESPQAARELLAGCKVITGAECAALLLCRDGDCTCSVLAADPELAGAADPSTPEGALCRAACASATPMSVDCPGSTSDGNAPRRPGELSGMISVPIVNGARVVGSIVLGTARPGFDDADLQIAGALGHSLAVGLNAAEMAQTLEKDSIKHRLLFEGARDAIFWADANTGELLDCNKAAEELLGTDRSSIIGQHQTRLHPPEAEEEHREVFKLATGGNLGLHDSVVVRDDGTHVPIEISTARISVDGHDIIQGMFRDISERRRVEARYQTLFREMFDAFALHEIICDTDGIPIDYRFLAVNPGFEEMTGLAESDVVGKTVLEVMPDTEKRWIETYGRVALEGTPVQFNDYSVALDKHFEVKAYQPEPGRFATIFVDITDRVEYEQALRLGEARLRMAQEAAGIGSWEMNVRTGKRVWSDGLWELYDIDPTGQVASNELWLESVIPADRARAGATVSNAVRAGEPFELEWKVNTRDGSDRWLLSRGSPIWSMDGELGWYIGIVIDVTRDRRQTERLKWTRRKLDEAHRIAGIGVWEWEASTDNVLWSNELCLMVGRDPSLPALPFRKMASFLTRDSWAMLSAVASAALETGAPFDVELEMVRVGGEPGWARCVGSTLSDRDGTPIGLHGTIHDITPAKRAEQEIMRHRRQLSELAAELLSSGERQRRRVAVDLHDDVGQALAAAKMTAQHLATAQGDVEAAEAQRLLELLEYAIAGIRLITTELSPPVLYELGLGSAIEWLAEGYSERYGLNCAIEVDSDVHALKSEVAVLIFRLTRELLNNVQRHSGSDLARVHITRKDDMIALHVEDDGCGFDYSSVLKQSRAGVHFGLLSIREEVGLVGGTLEIESAPGTGTRCDVRVPLGLYASLAEDDLKDFSSQADPVVG